MSAGNLLLVEAIGKALRWLGENVEIDREELRQTMDEMDQEGEDFWNDPAYKSSRRN